eukprot:NODE_319_length_11107_cov_0.311228.p6 type:complete len:116 gc:universal NODE_319_length_11107_cov_0.311228:2473-2820(+)
MTSLLKFRCLYSCRKKFRLNKGSKLYGSKLRELILLAPIYLAISSSVTFEIIMRFRSQYSKLIMVIRYNHSEDLMSSILKGIFLWNLFASQTKNVLKSWIYLLPLTFAGLTIFVS